MILDAERMKELRQQHQPNVPRKYDGKGHKVDDPVQCRKDLQAWPCDIVNLLDRILVQQYTISSLTIDKEER
jgi:hypothetical protein